MKDNRKPRKQFAREGATLVTVLVILLAGMALCGVAFHLHGNFVHRSENMMIRTLELNDLDEAVEKGKLLLEETIEEDGDFPKALYKEHGVKSIDQVGDLLAYDGSDSLRRTYDNIEVSIYDLDYAIGDIAKFTSEQDRNRIRSTLPPAMSDGDDSDDYHTYLIRAIRNRDMDGDGDFDENDLRDVVEVAIGAFRSQP